MSARAYRVSVARVLDIDHEPHLADLKFFMAFTPVEAPDAVRDIVADQFPDLVDVHVVAFVPTKIAGHVQSESWTYKAEVRDRASGDVRALVAGGVSRIRR